MDTQLSSGSWVFYWKMKAIIKPLELKLRPEQVFAKIQAHKPCFWLDSSLPQARYGTWSYLGFNPFCSIRFRHGEFAVTGKRRRQFSSRRPLSVLRDYLSPFKFSNAPRDFPFLGGMVGYLGYELGNYLERLPFRRADDLELPELALDLHQFVLGFHHPDSSWYLLGTEGPDLPGRPDQYLNQFQRRLELPEPSGGEIFSREVSSDFTRAQYFAALRKAKQYIANGDIYQVNLTQRFQAAYAGAPENLYRRLRQTNPAPYAGALLHPDFSILSSSPELFLRGRGREVITRPIKGTRPRGRTAAEDKQLKEELFNSEKDRAELVMIVDLERNDLGRVCDYGTVRVPAYPELESYARVHHLAATVCGRRNPGRDLFDLLRASFPGGSITGAPKVRAMEIIDELEPHIRGPYTGAIGWIGFSGNLELNIAIRIIILKNGMACFPAGGGIVADSEPELEYQESWTKALALWEALSGER